MVEGVAIPWTLRRSRRARRLRIVVRPGGVEVVAPLRMPARRIEGFVASKGGWIRAKSEALSQSFVPPMPASFVDGARLRFRGRFLRLAVEPAGVERAQVRYATGFQVRVPRRLDAAARERAARRVVGEWLTERLRADIELMVDRWGQAVGRLPTRIRIGRQKTLWGSCSARGVVSLNWLLITAPRPVLEYVVVHELCHLRELNHGRAFWRLVERLLPDHRERRDWLRRHGVSLG